MKKKIKNMPKENARLERTSCNECRAKRLCIPVTDGYECPFICEACIVDYLEVFRAERQREDDELAALIAKARETPMTPEEEREQVASFAFGNLAMTKEWQAKSPEELEDLRQRIRKMSGCK
jgi:hypothetical protein